MKLFLLFLSLFLFSCTKSKDTEVESIEKIEIGQVKKVEGDSEGKDCTYQLNTDEAKFEVTGYKFESKEGVTGTFKEWSLNANPTGENIEEILSSVSFEIVEKSLEFGKPARNTNILKGLLKNIPGDNITGMISSVDDNAKTVMVDLSWGGNSHEVEMEYDYSDSVMTLRGVIDLLELGYTKAFGELAKLCKVHHMKNGTAKTWSDVSIVSSAPLIKNCK